MRSRTAIPIYRTLRSKHSKQGIQSNLRSCVRLIPTQMLRQNCEFFPSGTKSFPTHRRHSNASPIRRSPQFTSRREKPEMLDHSLLEYETSCWNLLARMSADKNAREGDLCDHFEFTSENIKPRHAHVGAWRVCFVGQNVRCCYRQCAAGRM